MQENSPGDPSALLRQHPDYERAMRFYSDEEDIRVKAILLRRFGPSLSGDVDDVVGEILEDSEVIDSPPGSCGWLYSYNGTKIMIGVMRLNEDQSGITYGFQEC